MPSVKGFMDRVLVRKNDIVLYAVSVALCAASYMLANAHLKLSLLPHKTAMEYLYNFQFVFVENVGYEQTKGLFIIAQNCLGVNLFISLFLILIFGFLHRYNGIKRKIMILLKFYGLSLMLALFLTLLRIAASVPFCTWDRFYLIHNMISLGIYFMSGLVLYSIMEKKLGSKLKRKAAVS